MSRKHASHVAILAGGRGSRFWPVGRERTPKQFLALDGDDPRPLLAATWDRVAPLCDRGGPWVVAGAAHARDVRRLLPRLRRERLLLEPRGRSTAAAVGLVAHAVRAADPNAVVVVVPADHHVAPAAEYRRALRAMLDRAAAAGTILTLGLRPAFPATGYGYLALGERRAGSKAGPIHAVRRFVEKPDAATARRIVRGGRHLWNGGTFAFRPDVLIAAMEEHWPAGARRLGEAARAGLSKAALARAYAGIPSISIDYAVMENTRGLETVAARLDWDDLGSWDGVLRHAKPDRSGNVLAKDAVAIDASRCLVRADDGTAIALLGVSDLVVVRTKDALLVTRRGRGEDVRKIVDALRAAKREDLLR